MKRAGFSPEMILVLIAAGLGAKGFSKFRKTKSFNQMNAQAKANLKQSEPTQFKEQRMSNNMVVIHSLAPLMLKKYPKTLKVLLVTYLSLCLGNLKRLVSL